MHEEQHVIFKIGSESYGININYVKAIEKEYKIIPVPNAPANIKGMINLRGEIIPIYSLRTRFKMQDTQMEKRQLLIVNLGEESIAYEVDSLVGIQTIQPEQVHDVPVILQSDETGYIGNILSFGTEVVVDLSCEKMLTTEERHAIHQMMEENTQ